MNIDGRDEAEEYEVNSICVHVDSIKSRRARVEEH